MENRWLGTGSPKEKKVGIVFLSGSVRLSIRKSAVIGDRVGGIITATQ